MNSSSQIALNIIQETHAAIIYRTLEGQITEWNQGAAEIYGYSSNEILGQNIQLIAPHTLCGDELLLQLSGRFNIEEKRKKKDESWVWMSLALSPIKNEQGKLIGLAEIGIDISQLKKEKEQLHLALDNSPVGNIMTDVRGRIISVNKKTLELFGYQKEEIEGKTIEIILPERFREKHLNYRQHFFKHPVARPMGAGRDLFGLRKNGEEFPVEVALVPIQTLEGNFVMAAIVDITERKNNEKLWRSNQELEQFAYIASHDLQAPLRHISSYVQLLASKYADTNDPETKQWMNFILNSSQKMRFLISGLLDYSRVTKSKLKIELTNLQEILESVKETLKETIQTSKATIVYGELPIVDCSRLHIEQVFTNLIDNAIKFCKEAVPPEIRITSQPIEGGFEFSVQDNGIGIPSYSFDKVFQMFQRLEQKKGITGTGIGLAIVKKIIQLHNGDIWLESEEGKGAIFHFTIKEAKK